MNIHIYIYIYIYSFSHKIAELLVITLDIKHEVTNTQILWQPIKCINKKALHGIEFAPFAKEFRSLHNIISYFTFSSQSILQRGFERYWFHFTFKNKHDKLRTENELFHLTRSAESSLVTFKSTAVLNTGGRFNNRFSFCIMILDYFVKNSNATC